MFEKIHVNEFRQMTLDEMENLFEDVFLLPITVKERQWLKSILGAGEAKLFLLPNVKEKLERILELEEGNSYLAHVDEKLSVQEEKKYLLEDPSHFKMIIQLITLKKGMVISYRTNDGTVYEEIKAIPYKLEYSTVKKEWYILWYGFEQESEFVMSTPFHHVRAVQELEVANDVYQQMVGTIEEFLEKELQKAVVKINQRFYEKQARHFEEEKERILYCFSCFDKEIIYEEETNQYEIRLFYRKHEEGELLKRIRLLGERIVIAEPDELKKRILETALRALERYQ
jgi:predicted DNA-binding transcriptional regulator YafY